jgi:assimilatory nitrate reductase catalytic subunit
LFFNVLKPLKRNDPQLKMVVVDPRETATNEIADLHLPIKAGTDVLLFNALLADIGRA